MITMIGILLSLMVYGMLVVNRTIPGDQNLVGVLIFISLIPTFILFKMATKRKKEKWRAFTAETKKRVLNRQNHKCNVCGKLNPKNWEYDHIGSRGDNSAANCQALCLDCHADKTKREKRQSKNNLKNINEKPEKSLGQNIWKITKDTASQFTDDQTKKKKKR